MRYAISLDERSFDQVIRAHDLVVVDFWAHWCRPCRAMAPLVERLAVERPEVLVAKVDVDRAGRVVRRYALRAVPTLMRFDGGRPTATAVGALPYDRLLAALALAAGEKNVTVPSWLTQSESEAIVSGSSDELPTPGGG